MPQARAKMVRNVQPDKMFEVSDAVELMTREQFDALKADILPALRARGDPPPRSRARQGRAHAVVPQYKRAAREHAGGTLVRGYKLFIFPLNLRVWHQYPWKAQFHVVVARKRERQADLHVPKLLAPLLGGGDPVHIRAELTRAHGGERRGHA